MLRAVFAIIRLYFAIGAALGLILLVYTLYLYALGGPPRPPFVEVLGRALLDAIFRVFLWGPEVWQFVVMGSSSFLDWMLHAPGGATLIR